MKTGFHSLVWALALAASAHAQSVEPAVAEPARAEPIDLSPLKTADEFWAFVQKQAEEPTVPPNHPIQDTIAKFRAWKQRQQDVAEAFAKAYPQDPRRWQARLLAEMAALERRRLESDATPDRTSLDKAIEDVLAAPDADPEAKGEAQFHKTLQAATTSDPSNPFPEVARALTRWIDAYPRHSRAAEAAHSVIRIVESLEVPEQDQLLEALSRSANPQVADAVTKFHARQAAVKELRSKPVELKFTATNGEEIDLAKWRGKVVLLDFWASWCGPCFLEMPHLVKAYQDFHGQGFEIAGVSLDSDRAMMDAAVKKLNMSWPQYFEGDAAHNQIAIRFGVTAIPAAWLIDKNGMVRETAVRGEQLAEMVKLLLAEETTAKPASQSGNAEPAKTE